MRNPLVRNLQIGFGLSLVFLIAISVASYISINNLFESSHLVDHSKLVEKKLESAMSIMKDAETGQRGFLLTGDKDFLEPYNGSFQKAVNAIDEFQRLTMDNPVQQENGITIKNILLTRLNILARLIDKKRAGQTVTDADLNQGKASMDALRAAINKAEADEERLLHTRTNRLSTFTSLTPIFLIVATFVAIIISLYAYFSVIRSIAEKAKLYSELELKERETAEVNAELAAVNEELEAANEELASANEELNTANEELAAFNEELNAANDKLSLANEELNSANEQLAEAENNVKGLNEELGATNEELSATVDELSESQQKLQNLNNELESRVESRTRELTESESRFRVMMETMSQIAWTSNIEGEVTFFNKHWYDFTGLTEDQSIGWGWAAAIHPDDLPYASGRYKSILESKTEGEFETRKKAASGSYRWHLVRMQPVIDSAGNVKLWVGTATDIHELKNLQQQKDDFISIAGHELKTPITSLKVSLQLLNRLKDAPTTPTVPKLIAQANKSLGRVNVLVEDLLNVSKLNQGQLHLSKSYFTVNDVVNDCCQHVRLEGIYSIVTDGDLKLKAYGDPERIEQVVVNFVNNAIKYAPESKEIKVNISKEDRMAKVSVSDKGPGIPSEKVPHLFERYYRVDGHGAQFSGLGLGLYISSEIIKRHGGQIGVDTQLGKGSTFWFTIPLEA